MKTATEPITYNLPIGKFTFIGVQDTGPDSGACCPHCGAEGRYIYCFAINDTYYGAMAGCYKRLTGRLEKGEDARFFELLAEKQAKNKPLNGWDKKVINLLDFKRTLKYPAEWCDAKIRETLSHRKAFIASKRH